MADSFITGFGVFEWLRAPFRLKWSGNSLIRAMQLVLTPLRDFSDSYVDDSSVFSDNWTSHMVDLRHVIGSGRHGPDPEKLKTVEQIREPRTKSDLRKILGFFSYFRKYLCDFARIARPFTDLTCKNVPNVLDWSAEHKHALDTLKHMHCC